MPGLIELKAMTPIVVQASGGSLANGASVKIGTLDNTVSLAPEWAFLLMGGYGSSPTPGTGVVHNLNVVPIVDGANSGSVNLTGPVFPSSSLAGSLEVELAQTASQNHVLDGCRLGALKYDLYLTNQTGQTLSAGWTFTATGTGGQYT